MVRGSLISALAVGERPRERFAADERERLFGLAHEVGMALFALRALRSEVQVRESKARVLAAEARAPGGGRARPRSGAPRRPARAALRHEHLAFDDLVLLWIGHGDLIPADRRS